jgi:hypothetical protein
MEVFCNPGLFKAAGNSRITLRFIQATGMRSTSARGVFFWVTFFARTKTNSSGMNLCCECRPDKFDRIKFEQPKAGPQGETHGWVE